MINLLPESIREGIDFSRKNRKILGYLSLELILTVLVFISFTIANVYLISNNNFFLSEKAKSQQLVDGYQQVVTDAKSLKERILSIKKIKNNYDYWTKFNYALDHLTPASIFLGTVEKQETQIKISGYAQTKKDAVNYLDALKDSGLFSMVDVESIKEVDNPTAVTSEVKVQNFNFTLQLAEGALQ